MRNKPQWSAVTYLISVNHPYLFCEIITLADFSCSVCSEFKGRRSSAINQSDSEQGAPCQLRHATTKEKIENVKIFDQRIKVVP